MFVMMYHFIIYVNIIWFYLWEQKFTNRSLLTEVYKQKFTMYLKHYNNYMTFDKNVTI